MTRQRLLAAVLTGLLALGTIGCAADSPDETDDAAGQVVDPGTDTGATGEGFDEVDGEEDGG